MDKSVHPTYYIMDVITYPCWDQIQTMLVKAAQDIKYPTNRLAIIAKMYHSAEKCCWIDLTYLPLDKIAAILAGENFKCIFWNKNHRIPIWISLKFVPSRIEYLVAWSIEIMHNLSYNLHCTVWYVVLFLHITAMSCSILCIWLPWQESNWQ